MAYAVTFKGSPLTLVGRKVVVGNAAPDFHVVSQDMKDVSLADYAGKTRVVTFFPSLDTPVCDLQVKEFNKRAAALSEEVRIIGVSKDLPFAQKRFCQENGIKNISVVSDYRASSFGINYGVLVRELNLLARGVLVIDRADVIRYFQLVGEMTSPPDYEAALTAVGQIVRSPGPALPPGRLPGRCLSCAGTVKALDKEQVRLLMSECRGWELVEGKRLTREFSFEGFAGVRAFLDAVTLVSSEQGHHPTMSVGYSHVRIGLTTHAAGGLTENDFIMARIIAELV